MSDPFTNLPMNPDQLRATLDRLGLSQVRAAKLVGVDERTMRHWIAGNWAIRKSAAILLQQMDSGKISVKDIDT